MVVIEVTDNMVVIEATDDMVVIRGDGRHGGD